MKWVAYLDILKAVVERGSFSAAAEFLEVQPSTVTKSIQKFETELGQKLIFRSTRSLSLTEMGRFVLEQGTLLLEQGQSIEDHCKQQAQKVSGRLRISTSHSLGHFLIGPAMLDFCKQHPGIKLELLFSESLVDLAEDGIDLAIRTTGKIPDSGLLVSQLPQQSRLVVASQTYVDKWRIPQFPQDLIDHKILLFQAHKIFNQWQFQPGNLKVRVAGSHIFNSYLSVIQAVKRGLGIANVYEYQVRKELQSGELIRLFPHFEQPRQKLSALYQQRTAQSAKLKACLTHLKNLLS